MIIGITGGIGSGKSAVSQYLTSIGEQVICADEIAREVVLPGQSGADEIRRVFGNSFFSPDEHLDRKKLAKHVFADANRLEELNTILHPIIISRMFDQASLLSGRVFLDAALLIKADMRSSVDYVWLVVADESERIKRVIERDAATKESVSLRIKSQLHDDEMIPFADEVIENNESLSSLQAKVEDLLAKQIYNEVN